MSNICVQQRRVQVMRMWMVDPRIMCRQHLLGEHAEVHAFVGSIERGYSIKGYLENCLLELHSLYSRHEKLVKEMKRRGYRHSSPLDEKWKQTKRLGAIDREKSFAQLLNRCQRCKERSMRAQT